MEGEGAREEDEERIIAVEEIMRLRGPAGQETTKIGIFFLNVIKFLQLRVAFNFIYTEYFIKIHHSFILMGVYPPSPTRLNPLILISQHNIYIFFFLQKVRLL